MEYYIGLDVGGTHIVGGLVNVTGSVLHTRTIDTGASQGAEFVLTRMVELIDQLLMDGGIVDRRLLKTVGIGIPGFIEPDEGIVKLAANLPFNNIRIADEVRNRIGVAVYIHNDVKMIIYGEAIRGAGRGYDHVFGITLGTGLSSAYVECGKLLVGSGHLAGEIGHVRMEGIPYICGCGMQGCLETMASATGIVRQAHNALAEGRPSILSEWFPLENRAALTAKDVTRAYDTGDQLAIDIMKRTGDIVGKALAFAVVLYSPDVIVIGGGVSSAGERLLKPIRDTLLTHVHPVYREHIRIVTPALHDQAGVIGSAEYARMMLTTAY